MVLGGGGSLGVVLYIALGWGTRKGGFVFVVRCFRLSEVLEELVLLELLVLHGLIRIPREVMRITCPPPHKTM